MTCVVREANSDRQVGIVETGCPGGDGRRTVDVRIPIRDCRLWSPEDPFLYELEVSTGGDVLRTPFGMRSFRLDRKTGYAVLNGKTYFLRGTNVCIFRFFGDPKRGDLPWREEWVRKLHRTFKDMHWNSVRYCIGFPPEMWYRIADEEGLLIQDEFPIWYMNSWPKEITSQSLIPQYTEWMRERWNHPCVAIWDAQNETVANPTGKADAALSETGKAIRAVRRLDLSHRPWDNGWDPPVSPTDSFEAHPYVFGFRGFRFADFAWFPGATGLPGGLPSSEVPNTGKNPVIINEYGWGHLRRDGQPTDPGHTRFYQDVPWPTKTAAERQELHARLLAAETEFWRAKRQVAGVLHFCGLNYSKPGVPTSDHFANVEQLTLEPFFARYVRDAFAPVGLMVDFWDDQMVAAESRPVSVVVVNDRDEDWDGKVRLAVVRNGSDVLVREQACRVARLGTKTVSFDVTAPPGRAGINWSPNSSAPAGRPSRACGISQWFPSPSGRWSWPRAGRSRPLRALPAVPPPTPLTARPGPAGLPSLPIRRTKSATRSLSSRCSARAGRGERSVLATGVYRHSHSPGFTCRTRWPP